MTIPIVFCSSEEYLDYLLVALWSILKQNSTGSFYDIFIFHQGISTEEQENFIANLQIWDYKSIHFVDIKQFADKYIQQPCVYKETWFSLLAAEYLLSYDKALILDTDIIVKRDLIHLFKEEVNGLLAAAIDPDFVGQYNGGNAFYRKYYKEAVPVKDPYKYVQGGVYVMNLKKMRDCFVGGSLFAEVALSNYKYDDQDVINLRCGGMIDILDMRWNVLYDSFGYRRKLIIGLAPANIREDYERARENPWIIHYAGGERPWVDDRCDYAEDFWSIAAETPIAKRLLNNKKSYSIWQSVENTLRMGVRHIRFFKGRLFLTYYYIKEGRR